MNETPASQPEEEHNREITINIDANAVSGAAKGFLIGYFGVILLTGAVIVLCLLTLIIASAFLR